ncbi:hypothetical protein GOM49_06775 [Clostridium bovifaecis]|uniref:Uncharacterized protein n=1 Tax=Clostridium bovifaecis TaxID=2184719 RepID=A0A6I6ERM6_9CLOT|nr:hypothetical protein GOM49_06775 [Clostridium bovifaecis]
MITTESRIKEMISMPKEVELARENDIRNVKSTVRKDSKEYSDALERIRRKYNAHNDEVKHYSDYMDINILDNIKR